MDFAYAVPSGDLLMATSLQNPRDVASDYLALVFVIQQLLGRLSTVTLVKVVACTNDGGLAPWGTVDVIPLVNQVTGDGETIPHGTLFKLPYFRLQGGKNAVIIDPEPDDIGMAAFCSRDISAVKADPTAAVANANANKGGAPPGSARQFDMADGLYLGGFLNGQPEQYVQFNASGITVVSPTKVRVQAPTIELAGAVHQTNGDVTIAGNITLPTGDVTAGSIGLKTHHHSGVQTGGGTSGPPVP